MKDLLFGKTSFQGAYVATLAEMYALPAPVKNACLTMMSRALLKRQPKQALRKAIFTLSVRFTLPDVVPIAANVHAFVLKIFRFTCLTESSSRMLTSFTVNIRQAQTQTAGIRLLISILTIASQVLFMTEEDRNNEKDFYVANRLSL